MAGIYKIGSKLGYDLASGMKAGDSITATDGSIWTMGNDGKIQVNQNGNMLQGVITYQPTNQQAIAAMKGGAGYSSPYNATLQQAIAGIGSSQWGGWDKDTDESYKAYRKEYLREADRTMQDVLGQYAQNTGGIAGSSAIAAASQAADYQKAQLADKIPELYDAAYGRYMQDVQRQQQYAGLLMDAEQMAQNAYYKQIDYALSKWSQMGYADQEVAGILGVTAGTPTGDQAYTDWSTAFEQEQYDNAQQAAAQQKQQRVSGGSGGSGGGGGSGSSGNYEDLYRAAQASGNPKNFLATAANYKKYGFGSSSGLYEGYQDWAEAGNNAEAEEAGKYLAQLITLNKTRDGDFLAGMLRKKGYSEEAAGIAMDRLGIT